MKTRDAGFTLIELLIVLAILGVLSSLVVPMSQLAVQRVREQELKSALWAIRYGIDAYKQASDEGRIAKAAGDSGYPPNLEVLVSGVEDLQSPQHRRMFFLRRLPRNPLVPAGSVSDVATWGKRSYQSDANDPQEGADVYDVYADSSRLGLNGIPYRQW